MMKTILTGIAFLFASHVMAQQYTLIPDTNFENILISRGIDNDGKNGKVLTSDIDKLTILDISNYNLISLEGIEDFISLTELNCYGNQLTSLDVTRNIALTTLRCSMNQLTSLDVTKNTNLTYLECGINKITNLDISKNTALTYLFCYQNQLTFLDVAKNMALEGLFCDGNQLTNIDLTKNTALTQLGISSNRITTLNVVKNMALSWLSCSDNQLTNLDVTKNTALSILRCAENKITDLDVTQNVALTEFHCYENPLTSLDVTNNTALTQLISSFNQLTILDLRRNTNLTYLDCTYNPNLKTICISTLPTPLEFYKDTLAEWSTTCNLTTNIESESSEKTISKVYPNPCSGKIMIDSKENTEARILNVFGEVVSRFQLSAGNNFHDLSLQSGIYFIEVSGLRTKLQVE